MDNATVVFLVAFVAFVVIFILLGLRERSRQEKKLKKEIHESYGSFNTAGISADRMQNIRNFYQAHAKGYVLDDITWNDLDMNRLFARANVTYSSAGEEVLYHVLRSPLLDEKEIRRRDEMIRYFSDHPAEREHLQLLSALSGKEKKFSFSAVLSDLDEQTKNAGKNAKGGLHILAPVIFAVGIIVMLISLRLGMIVFPIALIFNMAWYFKVKPAIMPLLSVVRIVMREQKSTGEFIKNIDKIFPDEKSKELFAPELNSLKNAYDKMGTFRTCVTLITAGDVGAASPLGLVKDYVYMLLHLDLIVFEKAGKELLKNKDEADKIHFTLGYLEMLVAAASFREACVDVCEPVFSGTESAENIYHPLIKNPVKNSYSLSENMLLTGSNASGKSTFLKTVAVNMVLSETLCFACADSFTTAYHRIYSSMSLSDNLLAGDSFFLAEIKALKRILDAKDEMPEITIACFIDEVLKGTNTVERIAASAEILKYFKSNGVFAMAATHDRELTEILKAEYENYHFSEDMDNDDISFSYKLCEGPASTRNAIRLIEIMGYPAEITEKASERAGEFEASGKWSRS